MKTIFKLLSFSILISLNSYSQNTDESWKIYSDTTVARIDITINPASLEWIYNNVE